MSKRVEDRTSVMGVYETIARGKAKLVGFVADVKNGDLLSINILVERDSDGFANWLKGYVERLGVKAMAIDDLSTNNWWRTG